jgi:muramoyltetrapeptide carboxypeptidase LdcA involved in peptidoglycan recycling
MAINTICGLPTLYGPALVPSFGDSDGAVGETLVAFLRQAQDCWVGEFDVPKRWSNKGPSWTDSAGAPQSRQWNNNAGLRIVQDGFASGVSLAANVNTLVSLAGTRYFPDFQGKILFLEEMSCPLSRFERNLTQLKSAGAFAGIVGIVLSKPEIYDNEGAPFDDCELLIEVLNNPRIPVIGNFDCGHTHPMVSVPQGIRFRIDACMDRCSIHQMEPYAQQPTAADGFAAAEPER